MESRLPKDDVKKVLEETGMNPKMVIMFASLAIASVQAYCSAAIKCGDVPALDGFTQFMIDVKESTEAAINDPTPPNA